MTDPILVDTATLAAALEKDPAHVRRLVARGIITPVGRAPRTGRGGRPSHLFDLRQVLAILNDTPVPRP